MNKPKKEQKQKDQNINRVIFAIFITVIIFTVTVLAYNWLGRDVQDSLINMFFALIMSELTALGGIKITKTVKAGKKTDEPPDGGTGAD